MSDKLERLKGLLRELFQLDQPDLDFGIYRIMHAKSAEVTQFLDNELLPQVRAAFEQYQPASKAEIQSELDQAIEQARGLGVDPETTQKVQDLRRKLADDAVDLDALEAEVYDHLYHYFRRYYSEGDFLAKRVYKPGVYAIPYEGEEVKLHWANKDQYYIKTDEYLRDYAFKLRPHDEQDPMRVHFRLVDATEGEHGNVKATNERRFILAPGGESGRDFIAVENGDLVIRFQYRPATLSDWPDDLRAEQEAKSKPKPPAQADLTGFAAERVLDLTDEDLLPWIAGLQRPHVKADGTQADYSRLVGHLNRYTARNTFDYFIHKDLGGFLRRELDFFVKNEIMHLDDVESETAPRVEQYISKIRVIRRIAHKMVDFLAQLEDFQKRLWLKKKFVIETHYCITLDQIPDEFYAEIAANDDQREDWVRLFSIDTIEGDLAAAGYSNPLTVEFLKTNTRLPVDTRHFSGSFCDRLLGAIDHLDCRLTGLFVHGDNRQALALLNARYASRIKCVYSDPPFNTNEATFVYKNLYRHSSWCAMIAECLQRTRSMLRDDAVYASAIDDFELHHLGLVSDETFGADSRLGILVVEIKPSGRTNDNFLATSHEYYLLYSSNSSGADICFFELSDEQREQYEHADEEGAFKWRDFLRTGGYSTPEERPNSYYPIYFNEDTEETSLVEQQGWTAIWPVDSEGRRRVWRKTPPSCAKHLAKNEIRVVRRRNGGLKVEIIDRIKVGTRPKSVWVGKQYDAASHGTKLLKAMFGEAERFSFPKSLHATRDVLYIICGDDDECTILDYFAGSGTTGHAVLQLNRLDEGRRKVILVEVGEYFGSVLVPRFKKAAYSDSWKDGKPTSQEDSVGYCAKSIHLESYEDAIANLSFRRGRDQMGLLEASAKHGPDGLKEDYLLRYMLDVETRGSPSLLNVDEFLDPTTYKLKVKPPGSDESREVNVDLLETFNWLIGLTVRHIAAPQTLSAEFERDAEGRLQIEGRLRPADDGPWWFRTVTGTTPDGKKTLVIWRKRPGGETPEGLEQDNLVLNEWFSKSGYSTKDYEFDLIYVNGDNNLENLKTPEDTWKVRLIEEDFHRLMFDVEDV